MDRRNTSKAGERGGGGGIFIVKRVAKRAKRVTRLRLIPRLLQSTPGIIRHFLQAASHSTDIKIQLLLEKGEYLSDVSPIWSGHRLADFQVEGDRMLPGFCASLPQFFFFFFSISWGGEEPRRLLATLNRY